MSQTIQQEEDVRSKVRELLLRGDVLKAQIIAMRSDAFSPTEKTYILTLPSSTFGTSNPEMYAKIMDVAKKL